MWQVAALARAGLRNPRQISVSQHGTHNKQQSTPVVSMSPYTIHATCSYVPIHNARNMFLMLCGCLIGCLLYLCEYV